MLVGFLILRNRWEYLNQFKPEPAGSFTRIRDGGRDCVLVRDQEVNGVWEEILV